MSVGDGLRKILHSVYWQTKALVDADTWIDLQIQMGEQPPSVVNWKDEPDVERRAALRIKNAKMLGHSHESG